MCLVNTISGKIRGRDRDDQIVSFLGIPYAAPPIGNLRWKAPQPVQYWEGILECTDFPHCSYQVVEDDGWDESPYNGGGWTIREEEIPDEDCLYLNIWTTKEAIAKKSSLPVLCIIHGGAFETGSGAVPVLDGANMAKKGIVVVTINYRLGIFGYLAHPGLSEESELGTSGNYGVLDQIQALHWIQNNIEFFGGNPSEVTVSGESAGAMSVGILLESSLAKGLFARAALESGTLIGRDIFCPRISKEEAEKKGMAYMQSLQAVSIDELRARPTKELFEGSRGFIPYRDGTIWPEDAFYNKTQNDVPLFIGSNSDEGSLLYFFFEGEDCAECFIKEAKKRYGKDADVLLEGFPTSDKDAAIQYMSHAYGQKMFGYSIYKLAQKQMQYGRSDVYWYYFSRVAGNSQWGAFHSSELPYMLRNPDKANMMWGEKDCTLMEKMASSFLQFIKTGSPNGDGLTEWTTFRDNMEMVMEFGNNVGMIVHPEIKKFQIYNKYEK